MLDVAAYKIGANVFTFQYFDMTYCWYELGFFATGTANTIYKMSE